MSVNIKPLEDRVLVQSLEAEQMTASGLVIPDTAKEKPQEGKVIAVGPGKDGEPMSTKVGDIVLFGKHAGTEVDIDNKTYKLMREIEIFAIV